MIMARRNEYDWLEVIKWFAIFSAALWAGVMTGVAAALTLALYAPALPFVLGLSIGGGSVVCFC